MEAPTPHILLNILLGVTSIVGIVTALALTFNKNTRNFGVFLGVAFVGVSTAQTITTGYSDFKNTPYWWVLLIVVGMSLLLSAWQYTKTPHSSLFNKEFWRQWKRAFWMLFGIVLVAGMIRHYFKGLFTLPAPKNKAYTHPGL